MPPTAGIVGLMLALAGSVGLAGQTGQRASPGGAPARMHGSLADEPWVDEASRQLQADLATRSGEVRPVGFESPSPTPPQRAAEMGRPERPPHQESPASPDNHPGSLTISPHGDDAPVRLSPPGKSGRRGKTGGGARAGSPPSWVTVASSLSVVLGLFLVVAWAMRRTVPGGSLLLPGEVVEVLGRAALAGKAQVHLVRCGSKLLLVSLSPTGVETLTEITDPDEVSRLAGLCRQARPGSTTATFRHVLRQFAGQPAGPGPSGMDGDDVRLANTGVPRTRNGTLEGYDV